MEGNTKFQLKTSENKNRSFPHLMCLDTPPPKVHPLTNRAPGSGFPLWGVTCNFTLRHDPRPSDSANPWSPDLGQGGCWRDLLEQRALLLLRITGRPTDVGAHPRTSTPPPV